MGQFEYLLLFASVILALAVTDLAISLNRLLEAGEKVRWDWLAPLAASVAFLKIVTQWWTWFGAEPVARGLTFGMFLGVLVGTVLLFLMASAALPSAIDEAGLNMRDYYHEVSRRFWLLFAAHWVVSTGTTIWIEASVAHDHLSLASPAFLLVPTALILAFVNNRLLHTTALMVLGGLYLGQSFGHLLGQ